MSLIPRVFSHAYFPLRRLIPSDAAATPSRTDPSQAREPAGQTGVACTWPQTMSNLESLEVLWGLQRSAMLAMDEWTMRVWQMGQEVGVVRKNDAIYVGHWSRSDFMLKL